MFWISFNRRSHRPLPPVARAQEPILTCSSDAVCFPPPSRQSSIAHSFYGFWCGSAHLDPFTHTQEPFAERSFSPVNAGGERRFLSTIPTRRIKFRIMGKTLRESFADAFNYLNKLGLEYFKINLMTLRNI